ncbi:two-component system sensor histidine kinase YesM [Paenibacillus anaericanus]|uniref:cache domain-containing sensor histidine kinase n=1 Tax=Paenibacillus anaericanus TaxID=170367 RepID=UPI002780013D|nr:sensor histidine kinase [Paenibacillus anaericanus]MDQ0091322.1 two-component system sensor histidine kinase YesM [Paenibacillus anaericanus]
MRKLMGKFMIVERIHSLMRRFKIKSRIVFVLLIGLSLHLVLMLIIFNIYSYSYLKKDLYHHVVQTQREIGLSVELMVDDIQMLFLRFLVNSEIYDIINDDSLLESDKEKRIGDIIDVMLSQNELAGNVVISTHDGTLYSHKSKEQMLEVPEALFIKRIKESPIPVVGEIKRDGNGNSYIPFGQQFRNFNTGQNIGVVIIYVREESLAALYSSSFTGIGYSFLTSDNRIISHPDKRLLGNFLDEDEPIRPEKKGGYRTFSDNGNSYVIATYPLNSRLESLGVNWEFTSVISSQKLFSGITKGNQNALIFASVTFVVMLILSFYLAAKITNPLLNLKKKLSLFGKKNLVGISEQKGQVDEISQLESSYYQMVERINQLMLEKDEEKEKQRKAELTALQSQINPHFLYNTLDAISWIARLKKQPDIERLISSLATFFRISLHKGDKFVTVEEEIRLVQSFVTIEQMRFPDKFEIEYDIDETLQKVHILKLILQPIAENAIKHGISEKRGKGRIWIRGELLDDEIRFTITDDGVGFHIGGTLTKATEDVLFQSGYGLRNVDERIKLEYGTQYGLRISSTPNKGTTVTIRLGRKA